MSNAPDFFVTGRIDKETDVYVVAKTTISVANNTVRPNIFGTSNDLVDNDVMWSVMGVMENHTNFDDLLLNEYYHYDPTTNKYHYPVYIYPKSSDDRPLYISSTLGFQNTINDANFIIYTNNGKYKSDTKLPKSENYISTETFINVPLHVKSKSDDPGYTTTRINQYHNVYLNFYKDSTTTYTNFTTTPFYSRTFYSDDPTSVAGTTAQVDHTGHVVFYNPYQSPMNNLFKIDQSTNSNQGISLTLSSSIGNPSVRKHKNITIDDTGNFAAQITGKSDFLTLSTTYNIDTKTVYAGVPYKLTLTRDVTKKIQCRFPQNVSKDNKIIDKAGIEYSPDNTPNTTGFLINDSGTSVNLDVTTFVSYPDNTEFFFIPHHMYQVSNNSRREYTAYEVIDLLMTSPSAFNVQPRILHGNLASSSSVNYYRWPPRLGVSTDVSELAFTSKSHDSHIGLITRYCKGNEFCGHCQGFCDPKTTTNPALACILDTESRSKHAAGDHPFTCDHDRHLDSSPYVSKTTISHHSNSFIIVLILIAIFAIAGFILFEERKMILKHLVETKNGRHSSK